MVATRGVDSKENEPRPEALTEDLLISGIDYRVESVFEEGSSSEPDEIELSLYRGQERVKKGDLLDELMGPHASWPSHEFEESLDAPMSSIQERAPFVVGSHWKSLDSACNAFQSPSWPPV